MGTTVDELGVPFDVTVDFDTVKDRTVTIRDRDTTQQIRVHINELVGILLQLSAGSLLWADAFKKFSKFSAGVL